MEKGLLITLEGIDGSGKSSVAQALLKALSPFHKVLLTYQPGATPIGKNIRELVHQTVTPLCPRAEFLLFAADRAQHTMAVLLPSLEKGYLIISDRMGDSSLAYQGYGRGLDKEFIASVNNWALQGIKPDLTLYLRVPYEQAQQRVEKRTGKKTSFERELFPFFQRVSKGFDMLFENQPHVRVIDASQSLDKVCSDACEQVFSFLSQQEKI